ncbi:MAG: hypothetical protein CW338_11600, partial [Clostridiales bacterium]|nr:hypothetical protein [Clostridiales bacterium]
LYSESERYDYPVSGRLMLVAEERHILLLTAFLSREDAATLADEYGRRYRRQNRLPAQNQVLAALKERAKGED